MWKLHVYFISKSNLDSSIDVEGMSLFTRPLFCWCHGRNISPCKATVLQVAEFFLCLQRELKLMVPAVKAFQAAFDHVFSLAGMDLASSKIG